jgi:hypothetical protein
MAHGNGRFEKENKKNIHSLCPFGQFPDQSVHKALIRDIVFPTLLELPVNIGLEIFFVGLDHKIWMLLE